MIFKNELHEKKYNIMKDKIGFVEDFGEYASFTYLTSAIPNITIMPNDYDNIVKYLSDTEKLILDIAKDLYSGTKTVPITSIQKLDIENRNLILNAIKIRYRC